MNRVLSVPAWRCVLMAPVAWLGLPGPVSAQKTCLDYVPGDSFGLIHVKLKDFTASPWFQLLPRDAQVELRDRPMMPGYQGKVDEFIAVSRSARSFGPFGGFHHDGGKRLPPGAAPGPRLDDGPPPDIKDGGCEGVAEKKAPDDEDNEFIPLFIFRPAGKLEGLKAAGKKGPLGGMIHEVENPRGEGFGGFGWVLVLPDGKHGVFANSPAAFQRLEKTKGDLATVAAQLKETTYHFAIGLALTDKDRGEVRELLDDPRFFGPEVFQRPLMRPFAELRLGWAALEADKNLTARAMGQFTSAAAAKKSKLFVDDALTIVRILGLETMQRGVFFMRDRALTDEQEREAANLEVVLEAADAALRETKVRLEEDRIHAEATLALSPATVAKQALALVKARADDPNVKAVRLRTLGIDNLKQIGLALHSHHDVFKSLPPQAICDKKTGKPLLSWRVAILPFIEQDALYRAFKLEEPWDSPHNLKLLDKMPPVFVQPGVEPKDKGHTFYQAFDGKGSLLEFTLDVAAPFGARGQRFSGVADGLFNTLMVVEAARSVPWTKPDDIPFDPTGKTPVPQLGVNKEGFLGLWGDGSVEFIRFPITQEQLRAIIHRADNMGRDIRDAKDGPKFKVP